MFEPTTEIEPGTGWALQTVSTSTSKTRAQALTQKGNEGRYAYHSTVETENATFTASTDAETLPTPVLGGTTQISDYSVEYSSTEFPKMSVNRASNVKGTRTFAALSLPNPGVGVPSSLLGLTISGAKSATVAVSCQHAEEYDGSDWVGECRDVTVTVTVTGIKAKPTVTAGTNSGWAEDNVAENDANNALPGGTVVMVKHFPMGTDTDALNNG